jgi:hypothetical protein
MLRPGVGPTLVRKPLAKVGLVLVLCMCCSMVGVVGWWQHLSATRASLEAAAQLSRSLRAQAPSPRAAADERDRQWQRATDPLLRFRVLTQAAGAGVAHAADGGSTVSPVPSLPLTLPASAATISVPAPPLTPASPSTIPPAPSPLTTPPPPPSSSEPPTLYILLQAGSTDELPRYWYSHYFRCLLSAALIKPQPFASSGGEGRAVRLELIRSTWQLFEPNRSPPPAPTSAGGGGGPAPAAVELGWKYRNILVLFEHATPGLTALLTEIRDAARTADASAGLTTSALRPAPVSIGLYHTGDEMYAQNVQPLYKLAGRCRTAVCWADAWY